jgi:hypothetical protein
MVQVPVKAVPEICATVCAGCGQCEPGSRRDVCIQASWVQWSQSSSDNALFGSVISSEMPANRAIAITSHKPTYVDLCLRVPKTVRQVLISSNFLRRPDVGKSCTEFVSKGLPNHAL